MKPSIVKKKKSIGNLIPTRDLAKVLLVTPQSIQEQIRKKIIPSDCVLRLPNKTNTRYVYRIDVEKFSRYFPQTAKMFDHHFSNSTVKRFYTALDFSQQLNISESTMRRHIGDGTYPVVTIPSTGKKRLVRIDARAFVRKFPEFNSYLLGFSI